MINLYIKLARPNVVMLGRQYCIHCDKKRFFVVWHEEWYGWAGTCLKCGEEFSSDEWLPRPFARGWRKENIERAKKFYIRHKTDD